MEPTNEALWHRLNELSSQMAGGFGGVNQRLDRVNGQLDKHATTLGTHAVKLGEQGVLIQKLEEAVGSVVTEAKATAAAMRKKLAGLYASIRKLRTIDGVDGESKALTRRDLAVAVAATCATVGLFELLPRLVARFHP